MQTTTERPLLEDKLISAFAAFEAGLNGESKSPLHEVRRKAIAAFGRLGFPTVKNEDWRYTNLAPAMKTNWLEAEKAEPQAVTKEALMPFFIENLATNLLVFVNGRLAEEHCVLIEKDPSIIITSFAKALKTHTTLVEAHFARYAGFENAGTVALNTAYARNGAFVYVPQGKILEHPVHVISVSGQAGEPVFTQLRHLVVAEERAQASIIEGTYSIGSQPAFCNIVTEIATAPGAVVNHYKLQLENDQASQVNLTQVCQSKDSLCNSHTYTLGGRLVRNDLNFTLSEPNCESHLYGLYLPVGDEHFDNHSFVDHAMPQCYSNELYKGIMRNRSTAVFNGKILVRQDAQKTNAYQSNRNVLLSPDAKVDTKPQLEIFADDVKCSHGATVGQLDEEAIFYLRSRGIEAEQARGMLTFAFAGEVLENIRLEPLRAYLERLVQQRLEQE